MRGGFDRLRANGGLVGAGAHARGGALRRAQGERSVGAGGGGPCSRRGPSTGSGRTAGSWGERRGPMLAEGPFDRLRANGGCVEAVGAHACGGALRQAQGERGARGASGGGPCLRRGPSTGSGRTAGRGGGRAALGWWGPTLAAGPFDGLRANGVWGRGGPFGGLWADGGRLLCGAGVAGGCFVGVVVAGVFVLATRFFVPKFAPVRNNPPAVRARTAGCRLCGRCGRGSSRRGGGGWGLLWGRRGGRRA